MAGDVRRRWASLMLMVTSGFAGLGYQIVWTQQSSLWLGHESAAVLAVVAAFFGGLAAGGLGLGARIEGRAPPVRGCVRRARSEVSARPVRCYVACELVIAVWSGVLLFVAPPFSRWVLGAIGVAPSAG